MLSFYSKAYNFIGGGDRGEGLKPLASRQPHNHSNRSLFSLKFFNEENRNVYQSIPMLCITGCNKNCSYLTFHFDQQLCRLIRVTQSLKVPFSKRPWMQYSTVRQPGYCKNILLMRILLSLFETCCHPNYRVLLVVIL